MALENLVTGFLKKMLESEKTSAGEVLKDVINEAMDNKAQQATQSTQAPALQRHNNPAINGQKMFAVMMRLIADNNFDWRR